MSRKELKKGQYSGKWQKTINSYFNGVLQPIDKSGYYFGSIAEADIERAKEMKYSFYLGQMRYYVNIIRSINQRTICLRDRLEVLIQQEVPEKY